LLWRWLLEGCGKVGHERIDSAAHSALPPSLTAVLAQRYVITREPVW
jgi:hypothetical protein